MTAPADPLRVAFVDHAPFIGGAEASLLDLVSHLDRRRFDPLVLLPAGSPLVPSLEARAIEWRDLPLPRLGVASPLTPLRWAATARHLARLAGEHRIDLIHTNTVRAHLVSALVPGVPVVWMLHDDTFPHWLFALLRRQPAALVANSHATARHYRLEGDPRATVACPGVDTQVAPGDRERFRRRLGIGPEHVFVAHVGRLVRWKGQEVFLRAAAAVARAVPSARFAVIGAWSESDDPRGIGAGGARYEAELRTWAATSGLHDRCTFTGHQERMADVYAGIDLLVHSSIRPEPFGRVLVEAMAAGVPVIASRDGGPVEIVEDGVSGLLITPGSAEGLAEAMAQLLADPSRRLAMGTAARRRAIERFDVRAQVERLQAIYARAGRHR